MSESVSQSGSTSESSTLGVAQGSATPQTKANTSQETETNHKAPSHSPSGSNAPTSPEMFQVKVNGKMLSMTRDEVLGHASMSHAAQQRFEEAAQNRKQVEKIIQTAKQNPIQALMDPALGLTKEEIRDAFEKWYTQEFIEPETLSPEEKRTKNIERELERYKAAEKENLSLKQREEQERLTGKQREYLQGQIIEAMEKSGLPKTKFFAQRMAFYMRENLRNGWEAPIELIVNQVTKERNEILSDLVDASDYATLKKIFGEKMINKLHRGSLEELRERRGMGGDTTLNGMSPAASRNSKVYSSDVNKRLRQLRAGKT